MKRGDQIIWERRDGEHVRIRAVRRRTKLRATCWTEFTNQPGDRDWFYGWQLYDVASAGKDRGVIVWTERHKAMPPAVVGMLMMDLDELRYGMRRAANVV